MRMANVGGLVALLCELGASRTKLDTVTRQLRSDGLLRVSGHGRSARRSQPLDAARIILASTGSTRAVQASERLGVLAELTNRSGKSLLETLESQLAGEAVTIEELRVSRRSDYAVITDGVGAHVFASRSYNPAADHIRTEGIITGHALDLVRALLAGRGAGRDRRRHRKAAV